MINPFEKAVRDYDVHQWESPVSQSVATQVLVDLRQDAADTIKKRAREKTPAEATVDDIAFLIEQIQLLEHAQDDKKIGLIATKYRLPHFHNKITERKR